MDENRPKIWKFPDIPQPPRQNSTTLQTYISMFRTRSESQKYKPYMESDWKRYFGLNGESRISIWRFLR